MTILRNIFRQCACAALIALFAGLGGCSRDPQSASGQGRVALSMRIDSKTYETTVTQAASTKATPTDYAMKIRDAKGNLIKIFEHASEIPSEMWLQSGEYTVTVTSGTNEEIALDSPYYTGLKRITVSPDVLTRFEVVCTLANAKVSARYSEKVQKYFTDLATVVKSAQGTELPAFGVDAASAGYLKVASDGSTSLEWRFTAKNGDGLPVEKSGTVRNLEACTHYILEFDINDDVSDGGLIVKLVVDTDANEVNTTIDIPLKKLPEIKGVAISGAFSLSAPFIMVKNVASDQLSVDITGTPKITSVGITHDCPVLTEAGIPATFDLLGLVDDDDVKMLNDLGVTWNFDTPDHLIVDLTALATTLAFRGTNTYNFTFDVTDSYGKKRSATLNVVVTDAVVVTQKTTELADLWASRATLYSRWLPDAMPSGSGFDFRKKGDTDWVTLVPGGSVTLGGKSITAGTLEVADPVAKTFRLPIRGLTPETEYEYRSRADLGPSDVVSTFKTDIAPQLANMNFDDWYYNSNSSVQADVPRPVWGTANSYVFVVSVRVIFPETTNVISGKAARMPSAVTAGKFAAGNVFTGGNFAVVGTTGGEMDFGVPYTARPTSLSGWYDYTSGQVGNGGSHIANGAQDFCSIYVILSDWTKPFHVNTSTGSLINLNDPAIIAYGALESDQSTGGYKPFKIDLQYRSMTRRPTYALIVASASKYGDYFEGSTSSVMYVDEFSFGFE